MRKDRYLVGYSSARNVLYGKYHVTNKMRPDQDYAHPMTEQQAIRALKTMQKGARIFKMVEVKRPTP